MLHLWLMVGQKPGGLDKLNRALKAVLIEHKSEDDQWHDIESYWRLNASSVEIAETIIKAMRRDYPERFKKPYATLAS